MVAYSKEDRRRFPRIPAAVHVTYCMGGDIILTTTENMSRGGMRIVISHQLEPGLALNFIVMLKRPPMEIKGRIVWISSDRTRGGIQFERFLGSEWEPVQSL